MLESHACSWEKKRCLTRAATLRGVRVAKGRCKFPTSACLISFWRQIPCPRAPAEFGSEIPCFRESPGVKGWIL